MMDSEISTYDELERKFTDFKNFYHPLSSISYDDANKVVLCDSKVRAYNFDGIIAKLAERSGTISFCTVDAISFHGGYVNFIEFKDSRFSPQEKYSLYLKIAESYRWFEKILLNSRWLDKLGIPVRFILVYDPVKAGNGPESYRAIDDGIHGLAKGKTGKNSKGSSIEAKLERIFKVCKWLQYFDDIKFVLADDFTRHIERYC